MKMLIYKYENKINHKKYIGQTKNFTRRQYEHLRSSILGYDNFTFHKAIKKYGIENFDVEIVCYCNSKEELNEKEIYYIDYYKSFISDGGYNLTRGGDGLIGFIQSNLQRKKTSERLMGNKYSVGYIATIEQRRKISEAHKGKKKPQCGWVHTEEQKKQMSIKMKERGFTKEHREKINLKNYENRDKQIYKFINIITNEEIILSPYDFSKQYNIDRSSVTKLKLGKVKICKGWILKEAVNSI